MSTFQAIIFQAIANEVGFSRNEIKLKDIKIELELDYGNGFLPTPEIIVGVNGSVETPKGTKFIYLPLKWNDVSDQIDQTLTDAVIGTQGPYVYAG
jgi:hypothetical protein